MNFFLKICERFKLNEYNFAYFITYLLVSASKKAELKPLICEAWHPFWWFLCETYNFFIIYWDHSLSLNTDWLTLSLITITGATRFTTSGIRFRKNHSIWPLMFSEDFRSHPNSSIQGVEYFRRELGGAGVDVAGNR